MIKVDKYTDEHCKKCGTALMNKNKESIIPTYRDNIINSEGKKVISDRFNVCIKCLDEEHKKKILLQTPRYRIHLKGVKHGKRNNPNN